MQAAVVWRSLSSDDLRPGSLQSTKFVSYHDSAVSADSGNTFCGRTSQCSRGGWHTFHFGEPQVSMFSHHNSLCLTRVTTEGHASNTSRWPGAQHRASCGHARPVSKSLWNSQQDEMRSFCLESRVMNMLGGQCWPNAEKNHKESETLISVILDQSFSLVLMFLITTL